MELSLAQLNRATLARQMLLARVKVSPLQAIERLLAIQAQWPKPPFIALFSRLVDFERAELSRLAKKNAIVRGTAFRGTIFVMTAKDFVTFRSAIQPTLERAVTSIAGKRLGRTDLGHVVDAGRAFFAAKPGTFEELRSALTEKAKSKEDIRAMAYLVRMRLPLLQVATDVAWGWHASCDFALAESLVGEPFAKMPQLEALVLRYLAALGPATVADAQSFTGVRSLKETFEALRPKLVTFRDDKKKELFDLPKAPRPEADVDAPVRFLPDFDNVVLGHADRRRFVPDAYKPFVFLPGLAVARTFLVDGGVAGSWRVDSTKKSATLVVEPFARLAKKANDAVAEEGSKLLRFIEPEALSHTLRFEKPRT
jgi:hypothetical protein